MPKELLFEIGIEEIPARFISKALCDIEISLKDHLKLNRVNFKDIKCFATPRRLVAYSEELNEFQDDIVIQKIGPAKRVAFDESGTPTKALLGFMKSQGIDLSQIKIINSDKGEYIAFEKCEKGLSTIQILSSILPKLLQSLSFPKMMRWHTFEIRFARPIHWILALFGGEVIPFTFGNIQSGNFTYGHRLSGNSPIIVKNFSQYKEALKSAMVVVDQNERKKIIEEDSKKIANEVNGEVLLEEELLEDVTYLVEYPVIIRGEFEERFLKLPKEVLISEMKVHQKYFPILNKEGNLLPYFIVVANNKPKDISLIAKGNERVLRARFRDAEFFYNQDQKVPLINRVQNLKGIVYQKKLGTLYDKTIRILELSKYLSNILDNSNKEIIERASILCKADLVTGMVGEFPELQGVMGRYYAILSGENPQVAQAIYEHYLPNGTGSPLPETLEGMILSIADKIDTISGSFSIGLIPTGSGDPYGLRRAALGIIRIAIEKNLNFSLINLIKESLKFYENYCNEGEEKVINTIFEFFKERIYNLMVNLYNYPYDAVDAIISLKWESIFDTYLRIEALSSFKKEKDFPLLVIAFKRAVGIIEDFKPEKPLNPNMFEEESENDLYKALIKSNDSLTLLLNKKLYKDAMKELISLKSVIDNFFDNVLVNVENKELRENRLTLLTEIVLLFFKFADISKIVI